MANIQKRTVATLTGVLNNAPYYWSRSDRLMYNEDRTNKPFNGGFITLPNGGRFRASTPYYRVARWLEPKTSDVIIGYRPGLGRFDLVSTSGGVNPDYYTLGFNGVALKSAIGSMASTNGYPVIPPQMRNEAVTKALLDIANQKAGIAEDLATFRQTVGLLSNPVSALAKGLKEVWGDKSLRPLLGRTARDLAKQGPLKPAAQRYLEYVYGWKPLMSDIYGVLDMMKKQGDKALLLHGKGSSTQQCQCPQVVATDVSNAAVNYIGPIDENAHVSCKLWARIDPNAPGLRALNQLGLLNPVSLAWELVSWSFVIDWFVPIGPVLQALTAPAGLIFVDGSISVRNSLKGPYTTHQNGLDYVPPSTNSPASGLYRAEGYKRENLTSWPLPGTWINPNPFSGDRPMKALALLVTNLRTLR